MRSLFLAMVAILMMSVGNLQAQDIYDLQGKHEKVDIEKELSRQERKALQARIDSLQWAEAMEAVKDTVFTLEADQVIFKYGHRAYVSSNTNFVSVNKNRATVQVAFNVPVAGPNGMGGITLDGNVSAYKLETDKKGKFSTLSFNVTGTAISSRLVLTIFRGSDKAQIDIIPNFNSHRISLSGRLLPRSKSFVIKGTSI